VSPPTSPLIELRSDERVWVTGDVHIAPDDEVRADEFLSFLRVARAECDRLVLLGDVFDFWIGPRHGRSCSYRRVIEAFEAAAQAGFPIDFIPGNRDFLGIGELRAIGLRPHGDAVVYQREGARIVVTHGDLLVKGDHGYRRYRAVVRSALFRLCYWLLPVFVRLWAARRLRGASTRKLSRVEAYSFPIDLVKSEAWLTHHAAGDLLMGHLHREETHDHGAGRATRMLPGWGPGRAPHFVLGAEVVLRATTSSGSA
jgi:UDP-2,3-diacylglucosamine hydrolase